MNRPMRILTLAALAATGVTLLSGCPFSTDPKPPDKPPSVYEPRTSPANLLKNLRTAYLLREAAQYESLLAKDFEFYFSEEDQHIAEKYTRDDEIGVHRRMFSSDEVQQLTLSFNASALTEDVNKPDPKYPDRNLWTITLTNVDLLLRRTELGAPKTYELQEGIEQYWFRQESWIDPDSGQKIWTIVQWKELSS